MPPLLNILAHHSEPADPVLLRWILNLLDSIIDLGPLAIVITLGFFVVLIAGGIMAAYLTQRAKYDS